MFDVFNNKYYKHAIYLHRGTVKIKTTDNSSEIVLTNNV